MLDRIWGRGCNLKATREATAYLFNCFRYVGINPPSKWKPLYYLFSAVINISAVFLTIIAFFLSYFFYHHQMAADQLLTSLQVSINAFCLPAKIITVALSLKRLRGAETLINALDGRCRQEHEFSKIRNCIIVGNRLMIFYICFYGLYSTLTTLTSVIMHQPPYSIYMPLIDWRSSNAEFGIQSFLEYMMMNFLCFHQATDDCYAVIYIYILRTHMQILVERVRNLGEDFKKTDDEHFDELILCIKDHQNLLSLLNIISPIVSITIFVQFTVTAAVLGITMINIFIFADTSTQIASVTYFLAVLVQSSPCSYQATCLLEDSNQLSLAILHCNWFEKDRRFRKMLIFFILRAQTPITLTAMKLFPITLNTSLSIAKFSFSLYTLIKEMDFGQNLK